MIKVEYDKEVEVSFLKYNYMKSVLSGVIAHRTEKGKYYIKCLLMAYKKEVNYILNS